MALNPHFLILLFQNKPLMLCIDNTSTEPYFNQAAEEYLLKHKKEDVFMLWRNNNAIIVGKHQNTLAEINAEHVKERDIKVVRRLTGGGAVFHDMGNLNFTFIMNFENQPDKLDFQKYTQPIIEALQTLGIKAEFTGRNDLLIDGLKFSGNAEHIDHKNKRVLHHGTLLFASEIKDISDALKVNPLKYEGKARQSVRSRVTNISSHLREELTAEEFRQMVMAHIVSRYADAVPYELSAEDKQEIQKLADEKYSQWHWNFGYSPKYGLKKGIKAEGGHVEVHLNVDKGLIEEVKIYGDFFVHRDISPVEQALIGKEHRHEVVLETLKAIQSSKYFSNISEEELTEAFF